MKRGLEISMLIVAAIPLVLGVMNFLAGAERFVAAEQVNANLDNQLRFYAVLVHRCVLPYHLVRTKLGNRRTGDADHVCGYGLRRFCAALLYGGSRTARPTDDSCNIC